MARIQATLTVKVVKKFVRDVLLVSALSKVLKACKGITFFSFEIIFSRLSSDILVSISFHKLEISSSESWGGFLVFNLSMIEWAFLATLYLDGFWANKFSHKRLDVALGCITQLLKVGSKTKSSVVNLEISI